jgi:hypothetical protein
MKLELVQAVCSNKIPQQPGVLDRFVPYGEAEDVPVVHDVMAALP